MSLAPSSSNAGTSRAWVSGLAQTFGPLILALILGAVVLVISGTIRSPPTSCSQPNPSAR